MRLLKDRIRKDGKIKEGNVLKVDSFLNHQMDVQLFHEIGKEFKRRFEGEEINKILTIEASDYRRGGDCASRLLGCRLCYEEGTHQVQSCHQDPVLP